MIMTKKKKNENITKNEYEEIWKRIRLFLMNKFNNQLNVFWDNKIEIFIWIKIIIIVLIT